jgi:anaerobic magnesium-protoporphyrin IX monomethyl ester cyclase
MIADSNYKILLVSLFNDEAIGLRQLYTILRKDGHDAKLVFFKLDSLKKYEKRQYDVFANKINSSSNKELDIFCDLINRTKPGVIGFSLVSPHFHLYKRIYSRIRELGDFKIVLGGWQASLNPEECMPYCDILCIGDGEEAFPELINRICESEPIEGVKNLWVKKDGKVFKNPVRPLNKNPDFIPRIIFDAGSVCYIENDELVEKDPQHDNVRYGIIAGRGCPYHCTYCSNSYMVRSIYPSTWSKIRRRSVSHVMDELLEAKKRFHNILRINFYDEVFLPDERWTKEFSKRYKNEIALPFYCMFYPGTCKESMARTLAECMLAGIWMGIQSGSERVRREIFERNYSDQLILEQAEIFRKYDISVRYDFIFDNPFETFEESLKSIDLMLKLPEPYTLNLFSLKYFPKTDITKRALETGIINPENMDDRLFCDNHNYFINQRPENSDSNFVNHLAMCISFLASDARVGMNMSDIHLLIDDYKSNKDVQPVRDLLEDLLSAKDI